MEKLSKSKFVLALCVFISLFMIYAMPQTITTLPMLQKTVLRCLVIFILGIFYLMKIFKEKKIDLFLVSAVIVSLFQIFTTYVNHANIYGAIYEHTIIALSCLILIDYFSSKDDLLFCQCGVIYFLIIMLINVKSGIGMPWNKMSEAWYIGNRNCIINFAFPLLMFEFFLTNIENKGKLLSNATLTKYQLIRRIIIYLICYGNIIYAFSGISIIAIMAILIIMLVVNNRQSKIFNIYSYYIFNVIVHITCIIPGEDSLVAKFICTILGKKQSGLHRLQIYSKIGKAIKSGNKIIGQGLYSGYVDLLRTKEFPDGAAHPHNAFLEIMFQYGVIGVFLVCIEFVLMAIITNKQKPYIKNFCQVCVLAFLIRHIAERCSFIEWNFMLGMIYYFAGKIIYNFSTKKIEYYVKEY